MATYKTASLNEVAHAIAQTLDDHVVQPTKFRPNIGKCSIKFGKAGTDKQGLILVKCELPSGFGAQFELSQEELGKNFIGSLRVMLEQLGQAVNEATKRRHNERTIINQTYMNLTRNG